MDTIVVIAVQATLLAAAARLFFIRTGMLPLRFLAVATIVLLEGALIEAFATQAGAKLGSSSVLVFLAVTAVGIATVRPRWWFGLLAMVSTLAGLTSTLAYAVVAGYFDDLTTRIDESPLVFVPLAVIAITIGGALAKDLPRPPRRLLASGLALLLVFPVTRIGTAAEWAGRWLALAAAGLVVAGWVWLLLSPPRAADASTSVRALA